VRSKNEMAYSKRTRNPNDGGELKRLEFGFCGRFSYTKRGEEGLTRATYSARDIRENTSPASKKTEKQGETRRLGRGLREKKKKRD